MKRAPAALLLAALATASVGCGSARAAGGARVADAERMRQSLEGQDVASRAPAAFATAEAELRLAREASNAGDHVGAELHGERALASYNHAIVLARLARATEEEAAAASALAKASEEAARFGAQRRAMDLEAEDLDRQLKIAREAQLPAPSGPAEPERERARLVAAQALVTQARLLCGAARLVAEDAPGLAESEATVADLEKRVGSSARGAVPIDSAARARAACLGALTKARRAANAGGAGPDVVDALLAELTSSFAAAKASEGPPTAARDERGVVVTLRGAFRGDDLTPEASTTLADLGRVAAAHPKFGVQVVLHDAPPGGDATVANKRLAKVQSALTTAGAAAGKLATVYAGARTPVVDPMDAKRRAQNARLEIVFVAP